MLISAGTNTTTSVLSNMVFHLSSNLSALRKLKKEPENAIPNESTMPSAVQVENSPYLVSGWEVWGLGSRLLGIMLFPC